MLVHLYRINNRILRKIIWRVVAKTSGGEMWSLKLREILKRYYDIEVGIGSYGYNFQNYPAGTKIGNYCSLASYTHVINVNHPSNCVTTHPMFFNPAVGFVNSDFRTRTELTIGNDVWIGQSCLILPKVSNIGNGAIIGAGSVVTKNIEPYSIVAGNPARVIGYRFDKATIDKLLSIRWWDWNKEDIQKNVGILRNIDEFLLKFS